MKPDTKDLKRAVRKKKAVGPAPGGSSLKKARLTTPPRDTSDPVPEPAVVPESQPASSQATATEGGDGTPWSGEEAVAATAVGSEEPSTGPAPQSPSREKGKAPASERIDPLRRTRRPGAGELVDMGICWDDEGFDNPKIAGRLLETIRLTKDWEKMKSLDYFVAFEQSNCTLYKLIHEHALMQDVAKKSARRVLSLSASLKAAEAGKKAALELKDVLKQSFREREDELTLEVNALQAKLASALSELESAKEQVKKAEGTAKKAEDKAKKAESKNKKLKKKVQAAESSRDAAIKRREDDVLLEGLRAVNAYKASEAFKDEMTEAGAASFSSGIEVTIERVLRRYPGLDLADLETDEDEEDGGGPETQEAGAVAEEAVAAEGTAARASPAAAVAVAADPPEVALVEEVEVDVVSVEADQA